VTVGRKAAAGAGVEWGFDLLEAGSGSQGIAVEGKQKDATQRGSCEHAWSRRL